MFLPISASTLTTVVVFMPMLFISGVVGIMFGELAMIVTVTLFASLFTASTFTPMLCAKWLRLYPLSATDIKKKRWVVRIYGISERWLRSWEEFYAKSLSWCLAHKKTVIYGFLSAFILSLFLTKLVGNEFIPEEDSGDVRVTVELPLGTRLEETDKVAERIEAIFKQDVPEAKFIFTRSGETTRGAGRMMGGASGTHAVTGGAKLVPKTKRKRSVEAVGQAVRKRIARIPGVLKVNVTTGNPLGRMIVGGGDKAIQLDIIGHSFDETDALAKKIKEAMENIPGVVDASISREINKPELKIGVDRERAAVLGIDMATIADTATTFIEGAVATRYREKGQTYDVYVRLEESSRSKPEDIENLSITSPVTGKQIRLGNVAKVIEVTGPVSIERQNRERVVHVECNAYRRSPGKVTEDIKKALTAIVVPSDIIINFGGEAEEQAKAFKDLALLLLLGIILVYMVMAAQFESLLEPFIIMFAVPYTFTGVILAFVLTRTTLSVVTYLGIIMLMGIVVNNAIVLISYINILRARGYSMLEAVTMGGKDRLRPVLMTTITTLAGILPLALSRGEGSEVWQPLGITMLGGLMVSTLITMLFVPTLYAVVELRVKRKDALKSIMAIIVGDIKSLASWMASELEKRGLKWPRWR
jgi:HAE1 family hydrophobic/amphiphilic exporter-1